MKKKLLLFIGLIAFFLIGYKIYDIVAQRIKERKHREWVASLTHSASPQVHILKDTIEYQNQKRTIALYLPPGYEEDSIHYSVIYLLDGQALFDQKILEGNEWQVDEVLDSLAQLGQEKAIVVGIYNADDRLQEYKPFRSPLLPDEKEVHGDKHAAWIVNKLKPWIDSKYRTQREAAHTVIGGASLGGLMAYYMLMEYPNVFGRAIVFSPSFWVNDIVFTLHEANNSLFSQKIYFNAGQLETPIMEGAEKMYETLLQHGMPAANMRFDIEPGEGHWHMTWRKGFKKVYPWIVKENQAKQGDL